MFHYRACNRWLFMRHIDGMPRILITKETARMMAAKSAESRRKYPLRQIRPEPDTVAADNHNQPADVQAIVCGPASADDAYRLARLERVRKQIALIEDAIEETSDPMQFDQLTRAIGRLSEIERQLAGRPMPGSRRPPPDRQAKRPEVRTLMPIMDPEPNPVAPQPDHQLETSPPADTQAPQE